MRGYDSSKDRDNDGIINENNQKDTSPLLISTNGGVSLLTNLLHFYLIFNICPTLILFESNLLSDLILSTVVF